MFVNVHHGHFLGTCHTVSIHHFNKLYIATEKIIHFFCFTIFFYPHAYGIFNVKKNNNYRWWQNYNKYHMKNQQHSTINRLSYLYPALKNRNSVFLMYNYTIEYCER